MELDLRTMGARDLSDRVEALRSLARRLVRDEAAADDVVQEAVARALAGSGQRVGSVGAYLSGIAKHVAFRGRSTSRARTDRERRVARPEATGAADEALISAEASESVVRAVLALDEPYRSVITLRYFEGLPPRRIAERLERSLATVKKQHERGLAHLRIALSREHGSSRVWAVALAPFGLRGTARAQVLGGAMVTAALLGSVGVGAAFLRMEGADPSGAAVARVEADGPGAGGASTVLVEADGGKESRISLASSVAGSPAGQLLSEPKEEWLGSSSDGRVQLVITLGDAPLAGAHVISDPESSGPRFAPAMGYAGRTDERGHVTLYGRALRPQVFRVESGSGQGVEVLQRVTAPRAGESRTCSIALEPMAPGSVQTIRVVDEATGAPMPGATVRSERGFDDLIRATTDGDGAVRIPWAMEARYSVRAEGWSSELVEASPDGSPLVVEMRAQATVHGRITLPPGVRGAGTVKITVFAGRRPEWGARFDHARRGPLGGRWSKTYEGAVDPAGSWSVEGIDVPRDVPRVELMWARLQCASHSRTLDDTPVQLTPGLQLEINDPWVDAVEVEARFLQADGRPVPEGARIFVTQEEPMAHATPTTGERGSIRFVGVPGARWTYELGDASGELPEPDAGGQRLVRLLAHGTLGGVVPLEFRKTFDIPLPQPHLVVARCSGHSDVRCTMQPDGGFQLHGLPTGKELELLVCADHVVEVGGPEPPAELRFEGRLIVARALSRVGGSVEWEPVGSH